jgi:uncharacterized surface protein with fasciclin (FAS1) repeats
MSLKFLRNLLVSHSMIAAGALAIAVALSGCANMSSAAVPKTLTETIALDPSLSTLSKLITQAGLGDTLKSSGPFTVFAPSNEAFTAVPAKTMSELAGDPERLKAVLTYHVLAAKVTAGEVQQGPTKSVQGANLALAKAGNFVTVEDAMVTKADITASNGVVHMIDRVLIPPATAK